MRIVPLSVAGAVALAASLSFAQDAGIARPDLLLKEVVAGMPRGQQQEIKVLTATIPPGNRTVFHTHGFPVTIYVLRGAFTLEMEGRRPVTIKAGEAFLEPPHIKMTGYNKSDSEPMQVVIFYVSGPNEPFLHPIN